MYCERVHVTTSAHSFEFFRIMLLVTIFIFMRNIVRVFRTLSIENHIKGVALGYLWLDRSNDPTISAQIQGSRLIGSHFVALFRVFFLHNQFSNKNDSNIGFEQSKSVLYRAERRFHHLFYRCYGWQASTDTGQIYFFSRNIVFRDWYRQTKRKVSVPLDFFDFYFEIQPNSLKYLQISQLPQDKLVRSNQPPYGIQIVTFLCYSFRLLELTNKRLCRSISTFCCNIRIFICEH